LSRVGRSLCMWDRQVFKNFLTCGSLFRQVMIIKCVSICQPWGLHGRIPSLSLIMFLRHLSVSYKDFNIKFSGWNRSCQGNANWIPANKDRNIINEISHKGIRKHTTGSKPMWSETSGNYHNLQMVKVN
jgi:hypothetical protein